MCFFFLFLKNKQTTNANRIIIKANRLLKRDIEIKKETVSKYVERLNKWSKELPELEEKSRQASSIRTDGNDFDSSKTVVKQAEDKMEEEEEEDEFEEV
jgi:uncharacterized protein YoxC